mmetsp:Transcript_160026/g.282146  ORF Transcript_160026/g.282146 Transcript_160026/m.282146 type:complete len:257 (+) Transcript_160026:248-1018(+)
MYLLVIRSLYGSPFGCGVLASSNSSASSASFSTSAWPSSSFVFLASSSFESCSHANVSSALLFFFCLTVTNLASGCNSSAVFFLFFLLSVLTCLRSRLNSSCSSSAPACFFFLLTVTFESSIDSNLNPSLSSSSSSTGSLDAAIVASFSCFSATFWRTSPFSTPSNAALKASASQAPPKRALSQKNLHNQSSCLPWNTPPCALPFHSPIVMSFNSISLPVSSFRNSLNFASASSIGSMDALTTHLPSHSTSFEVSH